MTNIWERQHKISEPKCIIECHKFGYSFYKLEEDIGYNFNCWCLKEGEPVSLGRVD